MNVSLPLYKKAVITFGICLSASVVLGQDRIAANLVKADKTDFNISTSPNSEKVTVPKLDTVECLFHQLLNNNRPLLTWRKGYIVLEDEKIRVADQKYERNQASSVTGLIQNQFLMANKKKPVTKKVVQVVLLQ